MAHDLARYRDFPLFRHLDDEQISGFIDACETIELAPGEMFIEQGISGDRLYFLLEGTLRVFVEGGKDEYELAVLTAPAVVGEMEFLTGEPRAASVRSLEPGRALTLGFETLMERLEQGEPATLRVFFHTTQVLARRLAAMDRKFAELEHESRTGRFDELREFQRKLMNEWDV